MPAGDACSVPLFTKPLKALSGMWIIPTPQGPPILLPVGLEV